MPNLPTLEVEDAVTWGRLMDAFHGSPEEYKDWLRQAVRNEVQARELAALQAAAQKEQQDRSAEFEGFLDGAS